MGSDETLTADGGAGRGRICRKPPPPHSTSCLPHTHSAHSAPRQSKADVARLGDHVYCFEVTGQVTHPHQEGGRHPGRGGGAPQGGRTPLSHLWRPPGPGKVAVPCPAPREQGTELHAVPGPAVRTEASGAGPAPQAEGQAGGQRRWGYFHALRFWNQRCQVRKTELEAPRGAGREAAPTRPGLCSLGLPAPPSRGGHLRSLPTSVPGVGVARAHRGRPRRAVRAAAPGRRPASSAP